MKKLFIILAVFAACVSSGLAQNESVKSSELKTFAGTPTNGTSEVQTITIGGTPTGGTFVLIPAGYRATAAIAWNANNTTLLTNISNALNLLNSIGNGNVTVAAGTLTNGVGTITLTYGGAMARMDAPDLTVTSALAGTTPTISVVTTTPGVRATYRSATPGQPLIDSTNGFFYVNQSTTLYSPNWVQK